jgi:hypothetical protein
LSAIVWQHDKQDARCRLTDAQLQTALTSLCLLRAGDVVAVRQDTARSRPRLTAGVVRAVDAGDAVTVVGIDDEDN